MFVGNLPCSAVPEKIAEFVTIRASEANVNVKIYECKIFEKERSSSARLVLDAKSAVLVNSREFWPRPLYSRLWNFDKYDSTSPPSRSPAGDNEAMDLLSGLPNIRTETRPGIIYQLGMTSTSTTNTLRLYLTNAFGIASKFGDFRNALALHSPDIAIVTETKLTVEKNVTSRDCHPWLWSSNAVG